VIGRVIHLDQCAHSYAAHSIQLTTLVCILQCVLQDVLSYMCRQAVLEWLKVIPSCHAMSAECIEAGAAETGSVLQAIACMELNCVEVCTQLTT
jgi:hypothetical protein